MPHSSYICLFCFSLARPQTLLSSTLQVLRSQTCTTAPSPYQNQLPSCFILILKDINFSYLYFQGNKEISLFQWFCGAHFICVCKTLHSFCRSISDRTERNFNHLAELVDYYSNGHFFLLVKIKLLL